jgi:hypothetical protein
MRIVCLALALSLAAPAFAQSSTKKPPEPTKPTVLKDFEDEPVDGTVPLVGGDNVSVIRKGSFPSLIKIRTTFIPELIETAKRL